MKESIIYTLLHYISTVFIKLYTNNQYITKINQSYYRVQYN